MPSTAASTGAGDRVEIDEIQLPSSVSETVTSTADVAATATASATSPLVDTGGVDPLTAAMNAEIAGWSAQAAQISAAYLSGATRLGQATATTTAGITDTDGASGSGIAAIDQPGPAGYSV